MEETLKLILDKISSMDSKITTLGEQITTLNEKLDKKADKQDIVALEYAIAEKMSALFDAREVSIQKDDAILEGVQEVKKDISSLEKAVIRNTADIVDLKDYRKEN